jgi:hypothetical protein
MKVEVCAICRYADGKCDQHHEEGKTCLAEVEAVYGRVNEWKGLEERVKYAID